jgi:hypothetical protein
MLDRIGRQMTLLDRFTRARGEGGNDDDKQAQFWLTLALVPNL